MGVVDKFKKTAIGTAFGAGILAGGYGGYHIVPKSDLPKERPTMELRLHSSDKPYMNLKDQVDPGAIPVGDSMSIWIDIPWLSDSLYKLVIKEGTQPKGYKLMPVVKCDTVWSK